LLRDSVELSVLTPIHLAIPVYDLEQARAFYGTVLGCPEGRSAERWIDFNLFGHQLVCHLVDQPETLAGNDWTNAVDGDAVPVPHFGVVLRWPD
jgi:extradiol dioxygenase family protein